MINDTITMPAPPPVPPPEAAPAPRRTNPNLLLHCGAELINRRDLRHVSTPTGTATWYPLPHHDLLQEIEGQLAGSGFQITGEAHALHNQGARYFGILEVELPDHDRPDASHGWVVGLRNSHDKTFPAALAAGTKVLVCDNLCLSGEVRLSRKHTRHAWRDLRHLAARAIGRLGDHFRRQDARIDAYRATRLRDPSAHDLVIRAMDCSAITPTQVPHVLGQWRKPAHEEFAPRTAWSLFNGFTEVMKAVNPHTAVRRGEALHGLFDAACGFTSNGKDTVR